MLHFMLQRYQIWLLTGAVLGGLAVMTGAFGAHGLEGALKKDTSVDTVTVERRLDNWETAARYQMYHALGLLAVGFVACRRCGLTIHLAGTAMTIGTLMFSGGLYALVLSGAKLPWWIVPSGGLLMIVGWVLLAVAVAGLERGAACNAGPGPKA
jgi:uncharacterized membrane protein YgdD (TMEM256/DUF423 family)